MRILICQSSCFVKGFSGLLIKASAAISGMEPAEGFPLADASIDPSTFRLRGERSGQAELRRHGPDPRLLLVKALLARQGF